MPRYTVNIDDKNYDVDFPDGMSNDEIGNIIRTQLIPQAPSNVDVINSAGKVGWLQAKKMGASALQVVGDVLPDNMGGNALSNFGADTAFDLGQEIQQNTPQNMTTLQQMAHSGLSSAVATAPPAALAAAGAGVGLIGFGVARALTLFGMGAGAGADRYHELQAKGFDTTTSALGGLASATGEIVTELLPVKYILTDRYMKNAFMKYLASDIGGEQVNAIMDSMQGLLTDNPDMTLGEFWNNQLITLGATAFGGPIQGAIIKGSEGAARAIMRPRQGERPAAPIEGQEGALPQAREPSASPISNAPESPINAQPTQAPAAPAATLTPDPGVALDQAGDSSAGVFTDEELATPLPAEGREGLPPQAASSQFEEGAELPQLQSNKEFDADVLLENRIPTNPGEVALFRVESAEDVGQPLPDFIKYTTNPDKVVQQVQALGGNAVVRQIKVTPAIIKATPQVQQNQVKEADEVVIPKMFEEHLREPLYNGTGMLLAPGDRDVIWKPGPVAAVQHSPAWNEGDGPPPDITPEVPLSAVKIPSLAEVQDRYPALYHYVMKHELADTFAKATGRPSYEFGASLSGLVAAVEGMDVSEARPSVMHDWVKMAFPNLPEGHTSRIAAELFRRHGGEVFTEADANQTATQSFADSITEGGIKPGEVKIIGPVTKDLKKQQAFVRAWIKVFAPTMKVALIPTNSRYGGGFSFPANGVQFIAAANKSSQFLNIGTLAHEFGHGLMNHIFTQEGQLHTEVLKEVRAEWEALRNKLLKPGVTVADYARLWAGASTFADIKGLANSYGYDLDSPFVSLATAIDLDVGQPGYLLSFPEYLAEQMSRYVVRKKVGFSQSVRDTFDKILGILRVFFDRVASKTQPEITKLLTNQQRFENFIDNLRNNVRNGREFRTADAIAQDKQINKLFGINRVVGRPIEQIEHTTAAISTLTADENGLVKWQDVMTALNKPGVSQYERDIVAQVKSTLPFVGNKVKLQEFQLAVQEHLLPVKVTRSVWNEWGAYGMAEVGLANRGLEPVTLFFNMPGQNFLNFDRYNNHYTNPETFGHVRTWAAQSGELFVAEVQSDILRQIAPLAKETLAEIDPVNGNFWHNIRDINHNKAIEIARELKDDKRWNAITQSFSKMAFRKVMSEAYQTGMKRVLLAHPDTLIKIEGWLNDISDLEDLAIAREDAQQRLERARTRLAQVESMEDLPRYMYEDARENERAASEEYHRLYNIDFDNPTVDILPERAKPVYRAQEKLYKWAAKEFGGTTMVEKASQTSWLYIPIEANANPVGTFSADNPKTNSITVQFSKQRGTDLDNIGDYSAAMTKDPEYSNTFKFFQGALLSGLQLNQLARVMPNVVGLQAYRNLVRKMAAASNKMMMAANERIKEWNSISVKRSDAVNKFLIDEAFKGTHLTTIMQDSEGRWIHSPNENFMQEMKKRGINDKDAAFIIRIKQDFLDRIGDMERVLVNNVEQAFANDPVGKAIRVAELRKDFQTMRYKAFLPSSRFGKYTIKVKAESEFKLPTGEVAQPGQVIYFATFETQKERDVEAKRIRGLLPNQGVTTGYLSDKFAPMARLPLNFVNEIKKELILTPEEEEVLNGLAWDASREGSFKKYLERGKKYIPGASRNIRRVYADYMWHTANAISKMEYTGKLKDAIREVENQGQMSQDGNSTVYDRVAESLRKNYEYITSPQHELQGLRSAVSLWYLYASPKTAMMNLSSMPLLTYPHLAGLYGDASAVGAITKAMTDVGQFWRGQKQFSPDEQLVLQWAKEDGITDQSFPAELANASTSTVLERMLPFANFGNGPAGQFVTAAEQRARRAVWHTIHYGMLPFQVTEGFLRQATLISAYRLAVKKGGLPKASESERAAYQRAIDAVDYTQNNYASWNKVPAFRGPRGVFLIFYSFIQNMAFFQLGGDKGWWRSLMLMMALAGLQGMPGAEHMFDVMNWAWRKFSGEPTDFRIEAREFAKQIGMNPDLFMHGAMHFGLGTGLEAASSISMGRLLPIPTDLLTFEGDFSQGFVKAASDVGGPASSLIMNTLQAMADSDPNLLRRLDRMLPPAIRNLERLYRYDEQGGVFDKGNAQIMGELSPVQKLGVGLGFRPTELATTQELRRMQRDTEQFWATKRSNLIKMFNVAHEAADVEAMIDAQKAINRHNEGVPFPELRVTKEDIKASRERSERSRKKREEEKGSAKRYDRVFQDIRLRSQ